MKLVINVSPTLAPEVKNFVQGLDTHYKLTIFYRISSLCIHLIGLVHSVNFRNDNNNNSNSNNNCYNNNKDSDTDNINSNNNNNNNRIDETDDGR